MKHCGQCCLTLIQPFVPFDSPNCSQTWRFLISNEKIEFLSLTGESVTMGGNYRWKKVYFSCKANFDQSCKKTFLREGINKTIANESERHCGKYLRKKPQLALKLDNTKKLVEIIAQFKLIYQVVTWFIDICTRKTWRLIEGHSRSVDQKMSKEVNGTNANQNITKKIFITDMYQVGFIYSDFCFSLSSPKLHRQQLTCTTEMKISLGRSSFLSCIRVLFQKNQRICINLYTFLFLFE